MTDTDRLRALAQAAREWDLSDDTLAPAWDDPPHEFADEAADYDRILALLDELDALRAVAEAAREVRLRPFGTGAIGAQIDLDAALARLEVTT